jgi:hypothetical protein
MPFLDCVLYAHTVDECGAEGDTYIGSLHRDFANRCLNQALRLVAIMHDVSSTITELTLFESGEKRGKFGFNRLLDQLACPLAQEFAQWICIRFSTGKRNQVTLFHDGVSSVGYVFCNSQSTRYASSLQLKHQIQL